jgi:hypothetical protein
VLEPGRYGIVEVQDALRRPRLGRRIGALRAADAGPGRRQQRDGPAPQPLPQNGAARASSTKVSAPSEYVQHAWYLPNRCHGGKARALEIALPEQAITSQ